MVAVKCMSPAPEADKPTFGLSFVQVNTAPGVPVIIISTCSPTQAQMKGIKSETGIGLTVMVNVTDGPVLGAKKGVTVMVATSGLVTTAAVKLILPLPFADKPVAVLLFTQLKVDPGVPVKLIMTDWPLQIVKLAGGFTNGCPFKSKHTKQQTKISNIKCSLKQRRRQNISLKKLSLASGWWRLGLLV